MLNTAAVVQLCIIGVEMRSHIVTFGQVGDILRVCRKRYRAEDRALGHILWGSSQSGARCRRMTELVVPLSHDEESRWIKDGLKSL